MRLITFSFFKNCKFKMCYRRPTLRQLSSGAASAEINVEKPSGAGSLVEISPSWKVEEECELRASLLRDMRVLPEFVSEREEAALLAELEPILKRMRYEFDHWDNAIEGYRETERTTWSAENEAVLKRVKAEAFTDSSAGQPLPHAHVLDLAAAGHIAPHVDAVRFCGEVIAGISLASTAVMRLQHCERPQLVLNVLLQQRSLYIMRGVARYSFTHAVLGGEASEWRGVRVPRRRRIAVICRSRPAPATQ